MSVRAPVTSQSDEWCTPQWLFDALNHEFGFNFDAAANESNAKCLAFSSDIQNDERLQQSNLRIFCNPPYSNIEMFIDIAIRDNHPWIFLLPAGRTDNDWFHTLRRSPKVRFRYFRKRVAFISDGVAMKSPPFTPMVVIINGG